MITVTQKQILGKKTNHRHDNRHSITQGVQLDIFGNQKQILKQEAILTENQLKLIEVLYLNQSCNITNSFLFKVLKGNVGERTVDRFIRKALMSGWIEQVKIIKGKVIQNNMFGFVRSKDIYENGEPVTDRRIKCYKITAKGMRVYEVNNNLK